ncbi:MAG: protein kinase [Planctomycetes bacterium]|nr:protein kinase [Planctomycetota bacterium]
MGEVHLRATRASSVASRSALPEELRADPERRARFLREARAVAQLSHPNITQIFEVGEVDGRDFIAFELVEGSTLQERIAERPLTLVEIVDLALPLADAIAYAHERGIVHRDLKAANVMVTPRGHAKLLDFGLAKILHEGSNAPQQRKTTTLTMQGAIFGTPGAMSPEQALGKPIDVRSDIFSFGSLLYEMAAARAAFRGETVMEVMDAVIHREPDPLARLRADLPAQFVACVAKALRKEPGERYQTMNDLAADLRHFKRTTDSGLVPPAQARGGQRIALSAAAVAVLAIGGWLGWRATHPQPSGAPAAAERRALAVLPFTNLGGSAEDATFAAGLHSDVLTRLAKIGSLKVIARTSVLEYAATQKPLRQIGAELGVSSILSGEVQRSGNALRFNLTLHDALSEDSLWAESYNRELTSKDLFAVQSEIAEAIARALQAQLSPADKRQLRSIPTTNDKAYDAYLTGQALANKETSAALRQSIAALESAVTLDPRFAQAWASLAQARGVLYWLFEPTNSEILASAFDAAQRALELQPELPEAHLSLGRLHYFSRDYEAAKGEYEIAERGLPGSLDLLHARAVLLRRIGKWDESASEFARAVDLSPREAGLHFDLAITLLFLGRYDEGIRHFELDHALTGAPEGDFYYALCVINRDGRVDPEVLERVAVEKGKGNPEGLIHRWRLRILAHDLAVARSELDAIPERLSSHWYEYSRALLVAITEDLGGDVASAQREYETARDAALAQVQAHPEDARARAPLALALAGLGQRDAARRGARRRCCPSSAIRSSEAHCCSTASTPSCASGRWTRPCPRSRTTSRARHPSRCARWSSTRASTRSRVTRASRRSASASVSADEALRARASSPSRGTPLPSHPRPEGRRCHRARGACPGGLIDPR